MEIGCHLHLGGTCGYLSTDAPGWAGGGVYGGAAHSSDLRASDSLSIVRGSVGICFCTCPPNMLCAFRRAVFFIPGSRVLPYFNLHHMGGRTCQQDSRNFETSVRTLLSAFLTSSLAHLHYCSRPDSSGGVSCPILSYPVLASQEEHLRPSKKASSFRVLSIDGVDVTEIKARIVCGDFISTEAARVIPAKIRPGSLASISLACASNGVCFRL